MTMLNTLTAPWTQPYNYLMRLNPDGCGSISFDRRRFQLSIRYRRYLPDFLVHKELREQVI